MCVILESHASDLQSLRMQASFGKCDQAWMIAGGYCAATCNRCANPFQGPPTAGGGAAEAQAPAPDVSAEGGASAFPAAEVTSGYPLVGSGALYGQPAPALADIHSGVQVPALASQAQLQGASGAGFSSISAAG